MTLGTTLKCIVRLCKTSDTSSPYIDLADIQGPTLKMVENYGTTGSLTIVNEIDSSSRNLLSSSCSRWSSGTGALTPGMFLHIWHTSRTDANKLGVFIITEISPSDDVISVTFGDCVQVLRATGADHFRNYYVGTQQHSDEDAYGGWDSTAEKLYLVKPAGVTLDASQGDVKWAVNSSLSYQTENEDYSRSFDSTKSDTSLTFSFTLDADWLHSITLTRSYSVSARVRIYVGGSLVCTKTYAETSYDASDIHRTITLDSPSYVRSRTVKIVIDQILGFGPYLRYAEFSGASFTYVNMIKSGGGGEQMSGTAYGIMLMSTFAVSSYSYATSGEVSANDDTIYYITGIEGVSTIDSSYGSPAYTGRAKITYLVTEGGMLMSEIFSSICDAAGVSSTVITSTRQVGIMRCGGADYFSYLLALADMEEPSGSYAGRQHAFRASRTTWGSIRLGYRYKAEDTSAKTIYYAGDGSRSGEPFMAFIPTKTMQYRPYLAITRGTKDDGTPIILAMRDPDVSVGSASSLVDGTITEVTDAALSSYSEIATNRSKDWEGSVRLSGIHLDLMAEGTYVGGVPVRIYDTRYGMSGYAARVKEVTLDFTEQTTLLTLNNFSEMYANSVIDSSKMAYSAGGLAVEASSSDLFTLQYVRLESSTSLSSASSHTIGIYTAQTGWVTTYADVVSIVDLGIAVLSAYFKRGVASTTAQYGVTQVRVDGGTAISIPMTKRPDKYSNQSLVVNIQVPL